MVIHRTIGLLAGVFLLAGCAATTAAQTPPVSTLHAGAGMSPGMVMPDGSTMGAEADSSTRGPSAAARMICKAEARTTITKALGLKSAPASRSRWADNTYTCTYRLPQGAFVLSVKESASATAAATYLRTRRGHAHRLSGLTPDAYGTTTGVVMLRKDNDVLTVDASTLPRIVGNQHAKRADFAYQIASDILGCWTGD